ncbi:MAG: helix-turn-helix domain-containing protein [Solirubrobacteraceae bacterium]
MSRAHQTCTVPRIPLSTGMQVVSCDQASLQTIEGEAGFCLGQIPGFPRCWDAVASVAVPGGAQAAGVEQRHVTVCWPPAWGSGVAASASSPCLFASQPSHDPLRYRIGPSQPHDGELTVTQLAERYRISDGTVYAWISTGKLAARRGPANRLYIPFPPEVEQQCHRLIASSIHLPPKPKSGLQEVQFDATVPIPSRRSFPSRLGIIRSRTGNGR